MIELEIEIDGKKMIAHPGQMVIDVADENNVYNIYKLVANEAETLEFRNKLANGGVGYGDLKKELAEKIISFVKSMREKRKNNR